MLVAYIVNDCAEIVFVYPPADHLWVLLEHVVAAEKAVKQFNPQDGDKIIVETVTVLAPGVGVLKGDPPENVEALTFKVEEDELLGQPQDWLLKYLRDQKKCSP